jgi:hypothetical protein
MDRASGRWFFLRDVPFDVCGAAALYVKRQNLALSISSISASPAEPACLPVRTNPFLRMKKERSDATLKGVSTAGLVPRSARRELGKYAVRR